MDDGGLFGRRWEAQLAELAVRRRALSMGLALVGLLGWVFL
jgi:hypothetical protein